MGFVGDLVGKVITAEFVSTRNGETIEIQLDGSKLAAGAYLFNIKSEKETLGAGKLVITR